MLAVLGKRSVGLGEEAGDESRYSKRRVNKSGNKRWTSKARRRRRGKRKRGEDTINNDRGRRTNNDKIISRRDVSYVEETEGKKEMTSMSKREERFGCAEMAS